MARMPDIGREAWEAVLGAERAADSLADLFTRHHGASQAPADPPVTVDAAEAAAPHRETHMQISADLHDLAAKLEPIAEEDLGKLAAIVSNPATADVFSVLHLLSVPGAGDLSAILGAVKTLLLPYVPAQAQQQAAA